MTEDKKDPGTTTPDPKAPEKKAPEKKPAAKTAPAKKTKEVPAIFVRSRGKHFYRAGIKFTEQGHGIALEALDEDQVKAIRDEPALLVEDCTIDLAQATAEEE